MIINLQSELPCHSLCYHLCVEVWEMLWNILETFIHCYVGILELWAIHIPLKIHSLLLYLEQLWPVWLSHLVQGSTAILHISQNQHQLAHCSAAQFTGHCWKRRDQCFLQVWGRASIPHSSETTTDAWDSSLGSHLMLPLVKSSYVKWMPLCIGEMGRN